MLRKSMFLGNLAVFVFNEETFWRNRSLRLDKYLVILIFVFIISLSVPGL